MSKFSRQKSRNPDYEVGYGRPPVATQFPPKTSGNPRGRPPKARVRGQLKHDVIDGLSAFQRAVLGAAAAKVEVRRGMRTVKMTQLEAAVEGLAEAARNGNVRAVQVFVGWHSEAEDQAQREHVDTSVGVELTKYVARLIHEDGAAVQENVKLRAELATLQGRLADLDAAQPKSGTTREPSAMPDGRRDRPPNLECLGEAASHARPKPPADAQAAAEAPTHPAPSAQVQPIVRDAPPAKASRRRTTDPIILDRRPFKAGGWGVSGSPGAAS
jgi:hypothetical protein